MYDEPTVIANTDSVGSNKEYTFIQNNIKVDCSLGARYATYFSCNAGSTITFSATQAIKAIVINGYIKKGFTATANHGKIAYADASEAEVTADPVIAITDINSTSVTLSCVKQLRCYEVSVYFESNPDVEIGSNDEYNYDYEPTEVTTINATFDEGEYYDFVEGYGLVEVYLAGEEYEMDMYFMLDAVDPRCVIPAGTYPINDSFEAGTVAASPGGDDEADYPTVLLADFEEIDGTVYYNAAYYAVSGNVTVTNEANVLTIVVAATSYNGSTINATFTGALIDTQDSVEQVNGNSTTRKVIDHQQVVIIRNGVKYSVLGTKM